jgi:hypothetical protein
MTNHRLLCAESNTHAATEVGGRVNPDDDRRGTINRYLLRLPSRANGTVAKRRGEVR